MWFNNSFERVSMHVQNEGDIVRSEPDKKSIHHGDQEYHSGFKLPSKSLLASYEVYLKQPSFLTDQQVHFHSLNPSLHNCLTS